MLSITEEISPLHLLTLDGGRPILNLCYRLNVSCPAETRLRHSCSSNFCKAREASLTPTGTRNRFSPVAAIVNVVGEVLGNSWALWFTKTLHALHYNDFLLLGVTPSAWIAGESGVSGSCSQRVWTDKGCASALIKGKELGRWQNSS